MQTFYRKRINKLFSVILIAIFFTSFTLTALPAKVMAAMPTNTLEITGDGVTPITFTREQLEEMKQYQQIYSVINTWPTKKWYVGKGVKLSELLEKAEIKDEAKLIKFSSIDGYAVTLTVQELLKDKRYYYPNFKDDSLGDGDGVVTGSTAGAQLVEPIVGLISIEGSNNPKYMNNLNSLILMVGQRGVNEQTGNLFVKYLNKIEVLTDEPEDWDIPQANPESGVIPEGTMITLTNKNMDDDKVYYTIDGTTPNLNSLMYNKIAKRWWSARADVLGLYNPPIGPINENTIIKAITIGPGKKDSEVVTFSYEIEDTLSENGTENVVDNQIDDNQKDDTSVIPEPKDNDTEVKILSDTKTHWAKDNISKLIATGSVSGYPDGTFKPDQTITRAEFASILCNVFKFESKGSKTFNDTKEHWANDNIAKAAAAGVVSGYNDETFGPNDLITREQMAVMIARAVNLELVVEEINFDDSDNISGWAKPAMTTVNKNGIMKGYPDNTIRPQGKASRAEAVTVIINALPVTR